MMQRCIGLAKKGMGNVSPNPLVGCVIAKDGKIISEGYHKKFGGDHAEIDAIKNAIKSGKQLKGTTLYVNLEPCSHSGKTPPCTDEIIKQKFAKVVIGMQDPNPLVTGNGIRFLKKNKIKVSENILEDECKKLNKFYLKNISTGLPYVTMKIAQTIDGYIADKNYEFKWITTEESRAYVHGLRNEYDAVLVGRNTLDKDNPKLNVRLVKGRDPYRIVVDTRLASLTNRKIFKDELRQKTIVITASRHDFKKAAALINKGITIIEADSSSGVIDLQDALAKLYKKDIGSILVEGGAETYNYFLEQGMVDDVLIFTSQRIMGDGIKALRHGSLDGFTITSTEKINHDILTTLIKNPPAERAGKS